MNYRTKLESDYSFLEKIAKLLDDAEQTGIAVPAKVRVYIGRSSNNADVSAAAGGHHLDRAKLRNNDYSKKSSQITRIEFQVPGLYNNPDYQVAFRSDTDSSYRTIHLVYSKSELQEREKTLAFLGLVEDIFPPLKISPLIDKNTESLLSDLHAVRDSISTQSEQALAKLADTISNVHAESVKRIDDHIRNRDEHFLELEERHRDKVEAEQRRIAELESALMAKEASLNLKEPIGERRRIHTELRKRLIEQVENFRPSRSVNHSRAFVRIANFALIGISIAAFAFFALKFTGSEEQKTESNATISLADAKVSASASNDPASPFYILAYIKLTLSALAVFGFSAAYIRWEGRVADRLSETEFRIRDKAVDIERSAWIVETVEALTASGKVLPDGLLELLGNNLFENRDRKESEAENLSNFLQHLVGKKGDFETHLPGGGSVTLKADGARPKPE
ncbi:MAG: hypothetical protein J0M04_17290 [Verrucomicrobia bacterium]|nr:hypothetical protein [Verrucomicrobiota bacterium]